jgi:hypothetical protein
LTPRGVCGTNSHAPEMGRGFFFCFIDNSLRTIRQTTLMKTYNKSICPLTFFTTGGFGSGAFLAICVGSIAK